MLSLDGNVIIVFLIVWILLFALTRLFFNPIRRVRNAREKVIQENKEAFENALKSYEESTGEVDLALREARVAAENVRASLAAEAQAERSRLVAEVNAECRRQVEQAQADLRASVRELNRELESQVEALAGQIERKLVD